MISIAIDGACRRNGKPDCVSAGAAFFKKYDESPLHCEYFNISRAEKESTNQRGEMYALLSALKWLAIEPPDSVHIITDSEYLFNAMTKGWYKSWAYSSWLTAANTAVKNADIWKLIQAEMNVCEKHDIIFYHIKGHVIPFGKVTASNLLLADPTGQKLYEAAATKFEKSQKSRAAALEEAQILSEKNNGFRLPHEVFRDFVVSNIVVDAVATQAVEKADRES